MSVSLNHVWIQSRTGRRRVSGGAEGEVSLGSVPRAVLEGPGGPRSGVVKREEWRIEGDRVTRVGSRKRER